MGHQIKDFCFFSDWLLTVLVVEFLWWWIFHEIRGKWFNYYYVLCVAFEASPALPPVFYIGKFCGGRRVHWTTLNLVCKCMSVFYAMLCRWTIYTRCLPYILVRGTKNEVKKKKVSCWKLQGRTKQGTCCRTQPGRTLRPCEFSF